MGTRRRYFRLSEAELERALADPDWARARLAELRTLERWDDRPEDARVLGIDKSWVEIDLIMAGLGMSRNMLNGFHFLYPRDRPRNEDWEHFGEDEQRAMSPPTYRPPDQVRVLAAGLNQRPFGELFDAFDPHTAADIPASQARQWAMERDWVVSHGERLQRFFAAAADDGDATVSYLG